MYVPESEIAALERRYGRPKKCVWRQEISPEEMRLVLASRKYGRAHDVTFFIFDELGRVVLIRKPFFPAGVYRAPSGGIRPGEDFEEGALREAYEETGLRIELEKYLLRIRVAFTCGETVQQWTSHVFSARKVAGELGPIDKVEVAEVRYDTVERLQSVIRDKLLETGKGLFEYRVRLTDAAVRALHPG